MPQAMPLPLLLSKDITKTKKYRTKISKFGDGYSQRAPDGLNATIEGWRLIWQDLSEADLATVTAALDAVGGWDYLTWTPPNNATQKKFILAEDGYQLSMRGPYTSISLNVTQVFDL